MSMSKFVEAFSLMQMLAHRAAIDKGHWSKPLSDLAMTSLMHAEVAEVTEAIRDGNPASTKIPRFTAMEEELADVILVIMNFAQSKNLQVAAALVAKMEHNSGRPYRHGKTN